MRQRTIISGAAVGVAVLVAAGAAAAPRLLRRLRSRKVDTVPFEAPLGDPEAPFDPEANAAVRDELRTRISDLETAPAEPVTLEPDLIVEGVSGPDAETEAARARLRQKAAEAKHQFRS